MDSKTIRYLKVIVGFIILCTVVALYIIIEKPGIKLPGEVNGYETKVSMDQNVEEALYVLKDIDPNVLVSYEGRNMNIQFFNTFEYDIIPSLSIIFHGRVNQIYLTYANGHKVEVF